ncbi:MAG: dTMP kinase, partial [Verrucomicrobiota bacterium]
MDRGRLITFEGGEGCGKSTQVRRLAERLQELGRTVRCLREPGGTPLGEKLRHLLKHDPDGAGMAAETELLLMNASRAELVRRVLQPALAAGEIILCDRFYDSTTAYQGHGRGLPPAEVQAIIRLAVGETCPDLTLWLQVPTEGGRGRARARGGLGTLPGRSEEEQEDC